MSKEAESIETFAAELLARAVESFGQCRAQQLRGPIEETARRLKLMADTYVDPEEDPNTFGIPMYP